MLCDGQPCKATLYYRPFHLAHCDEHMRTFLKNTDRKCRRDLLLNYFTENKPNNPNTKHDSCDICLATCKGSSCSTVEEPCDVKPADETVEMPTLVRHIQEEDTAFLYEMLKDLQVNASSSSAPSVLGSAGLVFELGEQFIM